MMKIRQPRPLFIVFEGIDGSGKTTQARMLDAALEACHIDHVFTFEPSDGPTGRLIRSAGGRPDPEDEARLFTEDRRDHVERVILPALKAGRTVICDRYVHSSVAYQGARGIDTKRILAQNRLFAPEPDIVFFLAVPVSLALARIRSSRAHGFSVFEAREDLEAVDAIYKAIVDPRMNYLDGTLSPNSVHAGVLDTVKRLWSSKGGCDKIENTS
jgi:dTMP kinase